MFHILICWAVRVSSAARLSHGRDSLIELPTVGVDRVGDIIPTALSNASIHYLWTQLLCRNYIPRYLQLHSMIRCGDPTRKSWNKKDILECTSELLMSAFPLWLGFYGLMPILLPLPKTITLRSLFTRSSTKRLILKVVSPVRTFTVLFKQWWVDNF